MSELFYRWSDVPERQLTPEIKQRVISGEKVMTVQFTLAQGAHVGEHHHPHEQISHVMAGKVEFTVGGGRRVVEPGQVVVIPPNAPHSAVVLEEAQLIEIFSPPREDFLSPDTPDYMK